MRIPQLFRNIYVPQSLDFLQKIVVGKDLKQYIFRDLGFESPGETPGAGKSVALYVADVSMSDEPQERRRSLVNALPCDVATAGQFLLRPLYLRAPYLTLEIESTGFNASIANFQIVTGWVIVLEPDADPSCYLWGG